MPKVRLIDCIKLGFGFFIGYEVAKNLNLNQKVHNSLVDFFCI